MLVWAPQLLDQDQHGRLGWAATGEQIVGFAPVDMGELEDLGLFAAEADADEAVDMPAVALHQVAFSLRIHNVHDGQPPSASVTAANLASSTSLRFDPYESSDNVTSPLEAFDSADTTWNRHSPLPSWVNTSARGSSGMVTLSPARISHALAALPWACCTIVSPGSAIVPAAGTGPNPMSFRIRDANWADVFAVIANPGLVSCAFTRPFRT